MPVATADLPGWFPFPAIPFLAHKMGEAGCFSCTCLCLAVQPWGSQLTALCLNFSIYKMEVMSQPLPLLVLHYRRKSLALALVPCHRSVQGRPRKKHLCPNREQVGRVNVILKKAETKSEQTTALATCPSAGKDEAGGICPGFSASIAGHWLQQSSV